MTVKTRIVSSLEKCFASDMPEKYAPLCRQRVLGGERLSFQLLVRYLPDEGEGMYISTFPRLISSLPLQMREVRYVPNNLPVFPHLADDNYLDTRSGLYPDVLIPSPFKDEVVLMPTELKSLWFDIESDDVPVGEHTVTVRIEDAEGGVLAEESLVVERIPVSLPPLDMKVTQWFHCDCLADYYHTEVWSDEHFRIIREFATAAHRGGLNMILTPIHTPPLDTQIGGERTTTQLVGIEKTEDGYVFDFTLFDKFVRMMQDIGFEYFEMAHFFTQWGAAHAPKIVATVNGRTERIFGWESSAVGEEYSSFLRAYIPAIIERARALGIADKCYFHLSDEPNKNNYEAYVAVKEIVKDLLAGFPIMDAASNYELYRAGIVDIPIPSNTRIAPYLENKVEGLWTYYCCMQCRGVANNFIAMPAYRTRTLAYQMYKYNIVGFLQWGYNFYNSRHSIGQINPFLDTTGGGWVPGGDPFVVYPAPDGTPYESTRLLTFREVLDDVRLLHLVESRIGREKTLALVEEHLGCVTFDRCANTSAAILSLHNALIECL